MRFGSTRIRASGSLRCTRRVVVRRGNDLARLPIELAVPGVELDVGAVISVFHPLVPCLSNLVLDELLRDLISGFLKGQLSPVRDKNQVDSEIGAHGLGY